MVVIKRQGPNFSGDLGKDILKYERAKNNVENLDKIILQIQEAMFKRTGFHRFNLPPLGITPTYIPKDKKVDVQAVVKTQGKIKTPSYKEIYEAFTNYLDGIVFQLALGQRITGVIREKNIPYIRIDLVKKAYDITVGGYLEPSYRHKSIDLILKGPIAREKSFQNLEIDETDRTSLDQDDLTFYVRAWRIINDDQKLIKAYDNTLKEKVAEGEKEKTVQVSGKRGFTIKKSESTKLDYGDAVKTIISVPVDTHAHYAGEEIITIGELNQLVSPSMSIEEKKKMFSHYDLIQRRDYVYISIPSIYSRIEDLAGQKPKIIETFRIKPKEIRR